MTTEADVEAFVRRYFERRSAPLREEAPGVYLASLPASLRPAFDGADSIRIAFLPDRAAAGGSVDLAAVGSYLLDRIVEDATRTGWHTAVRIESPKENPEDVAARSIRPGNATVALGAATTRPVPHFLFNFHVRLTTDERVDRVESVFIDSRTLTERSSAALLFDERPNVPEEGKFGAKEIADAYRSASGILEARIDTDVALFREQAETLRKEEVARITAYFNRSTAEAMESRMADGAREARALELERDRRLAEAEEKYRFVGEVELCNVRTVLLDVTSTDVTLSHRGSRRTITAEFDGVNPNMTPLPCEVCGTAAPEPILCFGGHIVDSGCVRGCEFCDRVHCQRCGATQGTISPCATCARSLCPDHLEVCALSRRGHCPDHIQACAICGRTVGPDYLARCVSCEQPYCVVCVAPPADRCLTCRSLGPAPATDPAVAAVRTLDPALAKVTKWRRGSNRRVTVLHAKGLVWNQILVLDPRGTVLVRKKVLGR